MAMKIACSRRSDSGAPAETKASERAGKNEGRLGESRPLPQSPLVFFPLFFARAPLSERLEQAKMKKEEANSFTEILSEE